MVGFSNSGVTPDSLKVGRNSIVSKKTVDVKLWLAVYKRREESPVSPALVCFSGLADVTDFSCAVL